VNSIRVSSFLVNLGNSKIIKQFLDCFRRVFFYSFAPFFLNLVKIVQERVKGEIFP
jgi:hypothetical protein